MGHVPHLPEEAHEKGGTPRGGNRLMEGYEEVQRRKEEHLDRIQNWI